MNISFTSSQIEIPSAGTVGNIGVTSIATSPPSAMRSCTGIICVENIGSTDNIAPTRVKTRNQVVSAAFNVSEPSFSW
jgi:hypothetical protein